MCYAGMEGLPSGCRKDIKSFGSTDDFDADAIVKMCVMLSPHQRMAKDCRC
jgi:hypothetical protein